MSVRDNYSILDYGWMINQRARTKPWVEALRLAIQPGSVVLDIGTGTGFFAFLACQFGAARVYAVEPDDAIEVAKICAADNPRSDRITWLQGFSTEIELPEKVDVVIGDLHGNLPFHTGNITSLIDARRRHLKPGGRMIPSRDVLFAAPAHAPDAYTNVIEPWSSNEYGIDFHAGLTFASNNFTRMKPEPVALESLLAEPVSWGAIDYSQVESPNLDCRVEWRIERAGTLHGLYVWFDGELAEGLGYSNAPNLQALPYGRTFFPLEQPVDVIVGDLMSARLSATLVDLEYIYRWDTRITDSAGKIKDAFTQTTFKDRPLRLKELRRAAADYVPNLTLDGQIDCAIMQAMAQSRPLGEIAAELAASYPKRFADTTNALSHIAKLSMKYTA
jgi:protein arginine N-methyltransferase 1